MENKLTWFVYICLFLSCGCGLNKKQNTGNSDPGFKNEKPVKLPDPFFKSNISVEEAIQKRRSVRDFSSTFLTLRETGQLLWAAQGITSPGGKRTAPSAGGLYPLEIYLVAWNVDSLRDGVYHYQPKNHSLEPYMPGDLRETLKKAAGQGTVSEGAAALIITGIYGRTTWRFQEKGRQYVHMEAGHAAQNVCLQAVSLNIGTVTMGSFNDSLIKAVLFLPGKHEPLYIMPIGKTKE